MDFKEYQKLAARTINPKLPESDQEMHALHLLVGEVGEIHSLYQKVYQGHPFKEDSLKKEIGDLLWGIAELCTACEFEMDDIARINIEKLKKRYPDGFSEYRSVHRDEAVE